jgi:hypothetical protein
MPSAIGAPAGAVVVSGSGFGKAVVSGLVDSELFGRAVDFNVLDGFGCDALAAAVLVSAFAPLLTGLAALATLTAVRADLPAAGVRFFAAAALLEPADRARAVLAAGALEVFLSVFFCVFLDIRLPFVAFDGSIIRLFQAVS